MEERHYVAQVMFAHEWITQGDERTYEEARTLCGYYELNDFSVRIINLGNNEVVYKRMNQWDETLGQKK